MAYELSQWQTVWWIFANLLKLYNCHHTGTPISLMYLHTYIFFHCFSLTMDNEWQTKSKQKPKTVWWNCGSRSHMTRGTWQNAILAWRLHLSLWNWRMSWPEIKRGDMSFPAISMCWHTKGGPWPMSSEDNPLVVPKQVRNAKFKSWSLCHLPRYTPWSIPLSTIWKSSACSNWEMTFGLENRIPVHEQEDMSGHTGIKVQAK